MFIPDDLHERRFFDWNATVRGLVGVWELARMCGLDEQLGVLLAQDQHGAATEQLARIGNGVYSLAEVLRLEIVIRESQQTGNRFELPEECVSAPLGRGALHGPAHHASFVAKANGLAVDG